jgi:hypothetical protein
MKWARNLSRIHHDSLRQILAPESFSVLGVFAGLFPFLLLTLPFTFFPVLSSSPHTGHDFINPKV